MIQTNSNENDTSSSKLSGKVKFLIDFLSFLRMMGYGTAQYFNNNDTDKYPLSDTIYHVLSDWELNNIEIEEIKSHLKKISYKFDTKITEKYKADSLSQLPRPEGRSL